ncbi:MAG: hypothetical protein JWN43_3752, partial [Gammaproteobacteria bacterium]|nr:hypothetical protein [Gammaproteobacteria bacterium]
ILIEAPGLVASMLDDFLGGKLAMG